MAQAMTSPTRLLCTSVPKSGTHLLAAIFRAMGYRQMAHPKAKGRKILDGCEFGPDEAVCIYGHWRFLPESAERLAQRGFRTIVMLRDPRDICLSMADFLKTGKHKAAVAAEPSLLDLPLDEIRRRVITGFDLPGYKSPPIRRICEGWKEWQDHGAVVLKYEAIGQSVASGIFMNELQAIGLSPEGFLDAARSCYRPTGAASGAARWRHEFDAELRTLWQSEARGVASSLGYEELEA
jgi:hypothetical protein